MTTHIERVERVANQTADFFVGMRDRPLSRTDIGRIAALAADLMAKELTGETMAATKPSPKVQNKTHG
jgi:hypothetical protein